MPQRKISVPTLAAIGGLLIVLVIGLLFMVMEPWAGSPTPEKTNENAQDTQQAKAEVKAASNRFATAVKNERKTVSFLPEARKLVKKHDDLVSARVFLAQVLMRSGRLEKAATQLEHAVQINADRAQLRALLGAIKEKLGDLDAAKVQFAQAASLAPKDAQLRLKLANAQLKARDLDEARTTALQAIKLNSNLHAAHVLLSHIYEQKRQLNLAESQMARALELVPNEERNTRVAYVRRRAKLLRRANRPKDALSVLRDLPARDLFAFPVAKDMATTFGMLGKPMLAGEHYATMLDLNPTDAKAARLATRWYLKANDVQAARNALDKLRELSPGSKALASLGKDVRRAEAKAGK